MATTGVDLSVSGLASGFDWKSVVTQLANAERAPETLWQQQQAALNQKNSAFSAIKTMLSTLQTDVQTLKDPALYEGRTAQPSDATVATASADASATLGTFTFNITQMAAAAQINGATNIARALSPSGDLSSVTLGTAGFATAITAGTFTVNGKQITVATSDSLQQVFNQIATATNNTVTASYSASTDKITLTSSNNSEIVLGSATDTSNFLQAAQLYNNTTGTISSASALGSVRLTAAMADSDLATAISDGGSGQGQFTVNGVSISYNASTDSIQNVLDRITNSSAGVTASYDSQNDRFVLTNKTAGDIGIAAQDVTGNFLAATGLSSGTLAHGKNLLYTVNGGAQLVSQSSTITQASSNIAGLSVTALKLGSTTVTVASDTSKIKTAIQSFVTDYNNVQSYIDTQSATSTDSSGKVTAGVLTADMDAAGIASSLRSLSFSPSSVPGLPSGLNQLANLGIQTNGQDNTIKLSDTSALDNALNNNLNNVKSLFTDATSGWAVQLDTYLTNTVGDSGTLTNHQTTLTTQSSAIDTQIANLEKIITADSNRWTTEFQAMEQAQAQINQQLNYLSQQITNWAKG